MFLARAAAVLGTAALFVVSSAACTKGPGSGQNAKPEDQTAIVQPSTNAPITVTGCLRRGAAEDAFVLTAVQQQNAGAPTATYQLVGKQGVDFRSHIGQQVKISGTLGTQTDVASKGSAETDPKAKGTSGTPTVQTRTDLQLRTLRVDALTPQSGSCQQ